VFRPGTFGVVKKRYHIHMDVVEKACLVNRYIDGVVTCFEEEIGLFRRLDSDRQEDRSAAGRTDAKITVPFPDIFDHFGKDRDFSQTCAFMRMGKHVASIIGSVH
jgi:hypothetical protein